MSQDRQQNRQAAPSSNPAPNSAATRNNRRKRASEAHQQQVHQQLNYQQQQQQQQQLVQNQPQHNHNHPPLQQQPSGRQPGGGNRNSNQENRRPPNNDRNRSQRGGGNPSAYGGGGSLNIVITKNPAAFKDAPDGAAGGKAPAPEVTTRAVTVDLITSLTDSLSKGTYECMICYDGVKVRDRCIKEWGKKSLNEAASSSAATPSQRPEASWRCPGCQYKYKEIPNQSCYCRKLEDVQFNRFLLPHSCGGPCLRERACSHRCVMECHPGPCRPCEGMAPPVSCHCGRSQFMVRCSDLASGTLDRSCHETCGKTLGCGNHACESECHDGPCGPCPITTPKSCHCGKMTRDIPCGSTSTTFTCEEVCGFSYACGVHDCRRGCHDNSDHEVLCPMDPSLIKRCPCRSKTIVSLLGPAGRESCEVPIPTCGGPCDKTYDCGHACRLDCHVGNCPPCGTMVTLDCRCGRQEMTVRCSELKREAGRGGGVGGFVPPLCDRPCSTKRSCKRHQCGSKCCPGGTDAHACDLACGKTLKCGVHKCASNCGHAGRCHDCFEGVSFDELTCACGQSVIYPPIPCGTAPPKCDRPCERPLPCGHVSYSVHNCHADSEPCPPCVIFVDRQCACGRKTERCGRPRPMCGHVCAFFCHGTSYCTEEKPCKYPLRETCPCGNKVHQILCNAWKESAGRTGGQTLHCDDSCALVERNRKLNEALNLSRELNLTSSAAATGSEEVNAFEDHLLRFAMANPPFVRTVETTLAEFVRDASKRILNFPHVKPRHTQFVAGLVPHYNLVMDIIDADRGQASVVARKTAAKIAAVPDPPISVACRTYKPGTPVPAPSTPTTVAASPAPAPVSNKANGLHVVGLQDGIDARDLEIFIEPMLGPISIRWIGEKRDCVVQPAASRRMTASDIESLVSSRESTIQEKFLLNCWATSVRACCITADGEILDPWKVVKGSSSSAAPKEGGAAPNAWAGGKPAVAPSRRFVSALPPRAVNQFDLLEDAGKVEANLMKKKEVVVVEEAVVPDHWDAGDDGEEEDVSTVEGSSAPVEGAI
ncbi:FKBP12-associated protein [Irineochytrium annulatum]|nr:FKBP12-associated protein [Irineochytrium annulatum]